MQSIGSSGSELGQNRTTATDVESNVSPRLLDFERGTGTPTSVNSGEHLSEVDVSTSTKQDAGPSDMKTSLNKKLLEMSEQEEKLHKLTNDLNVRVSTNKLQLDETNKVGILLVYSFFPST